MHKGETGVIYHSGCRDTDVSVATLLDVRKQFVKRMLCWYLENIRENIKVNTHGSKCLSES